MLVERYLKNKSVIKRASPGEFVMGTLIPNRTYGWGGWGQVNRLEQVMHLKNWTYVAVDTIASSIGGITPNMAYVSDVAKPGVTTKAGYRGMMNARNKGFGGSFEISSGGHSFLTIGEYRSKALSVVKPHEELEPLENDHRLRELFDNPNPQDTAYDLLYELDMFLELCGVTYLWIIPSATGEIAEMWVIPAHWVWPRTGSGNYFNPAQLDNNPHADELIAYYEVRPYGGYGSAGILKFPPNEVIMIRKKSPLDKIDGYSPLAAVAQWIDTEESISKSRWAQFINMARPEFHVELGEGYNDPDDNQIARLESKFLYKIQGEANYGKPVITPPGAKITPLSFNPTEMAYFQCLSGDMECLTETGWKRYSDLTLTTKIACYDSDKNKLQFMLPTSIHASHYEGKMYHWDSVAVDSLMTPNHRVYTDREGHFRMALVGLLPEAGGFFVKTLKDEGPMLRARRGGELTEDEVYDSNIHFSQRQTIDYKGIVWCVTVPTGLFVVRRNGKAHITGNSEEQVASMILSTFKVPKTAVGISESMTYGSILATLSQMCVYCLNPRLRMLGQSLTKHLASRWDEERPSWSNRSHGGSGSHRKVKLWFDDTVPADPTQVNADMQADMAGYALSPNEIRAIRGRKPWQNGGDDPMGQGPGGVMPIPLNTGDDLSDLAKLIAPMTKPGEEAGAKEEMAGEGLDWRGDETKPGVESEEEEQDNGPLELPSGEDGALEDTGIEEPNGPPSKSYKELNHDGEGPRAKAGFSGKREDSAGRTICYENGKRVSCSGTPSKKPGKKPAADKPTKKPTVQQTTDSIKTLIAEGKATPKALTQALMYHTVPELKKLQEQLGVSIKGNKAKEDRAKEIAKQAIAAAKKGEGKEATKPPVAKPENKLPTSQPKLNQTTYPDLKGTVSPEVKKSLGNLGIKGLDNPQAIANVLGVPDNAESILTRTDSNGVVSINIEGPGYKMTRHMFKDDKGEVTIYNESIHITDTGTGLGTQILSNQVEQASNAGFKKIVAAAAGRPGSVWNGYYTWPRLGYDAAIPNDVKLPPEYAGAKNISDLLEKEGGAKWWKENGKEFDATFDLSPGSKSRKVLDAYNKAKKESKK